MECFKALQQIIISRLTTLSNRDLPSAVILAELHSLVSTLSGPLFSDAAARAVVLPPICSALKRQLLVSTDAAVLEEVGLVLGEIVLFLGGKEDKQQQRSKDVQAVARVLLLPLVEALGRLEFNDTKVGKLCVRIRHLQMIFLFQRRLFTCLFSLLELLEDDHYKLTWDSLHHSRQLKAFLMDLLHLFHSALAQPLYPKTWLAMRFALYKVLLGCMQELAKPLLVYFREELDRQLWMSYFAVGVEFLSHEDLNGSDDVKWNNDLRSVQLFCKKFHPNKSSLCVCSRHQLLQRTGNLRMKMGYQILSLWSHLGDLKQHFVPGERWLSLSQKDGGSTSNLHFAGMIGPMLRMTLIPDKEMIKSTVPVFFDLMEQEFKAKGNFKQVSVNTMQTKKRKRFLPSKLTEKCLPSSSLCKQCPFIVCSGLILKRFHFLILFLSTIVEKARPALPPSLRDIIVPIFVVVLALLHTNAV